MAHPLRRTSRTKESFFSLGLVWVALTFLIPTVVTASPVYTWTDAKGVTHFSSSPKSQNAKRAELPPIMRGEMKMARSKVIGCDTHGGVDCRAGADRDGSVICADGYRDATHRFRFSCSAPKLEVTDVTPASVEGAFSVFIRNHRSVVADKTRVAMRLQDGKEMILSGPAQIEAYGLAEYQGTAPISELGIATSPQVSDINISCANCP